MWCLQLIGKDFDLHFVSWTLKQDQIMCIQTNCARCFALLKQVLCNVDHTCISMMSFSCKPQLNFFFIFVPQHIVKDDQVWYTDISDNIILVIWNAEDEFNFGPFTFLQDIVGRLPFFVTPHDLLWLNVKQIFFVLDHFLNKFRFSRSTRTRYKDIGSMFQNKLPISCCKTCIAAMIC